MRRLGGLVLLVAVAACGDTMGEAAPGGNAGHGGNAGYGGSGGHAGDPCATVDCGPHGTCNDGTCSCDEGWAGAHCGDCAPHDLAHEGSCVPGCALHGCDAHEICDEATGLPACSCAPGFADHGEGCTWVGLVHDGEFTDPAAWHVAGGATVDPAGGREGHAGEARVAGADLCGAWSIGQPFTLPPIDASGPLLLRYASRTTLQTVDGPVPASATARITVGEETLLGPWPHCGWTEHAVCLGESAHAAGGLTFASGRPGGNCSDETLQIDSVSIEPAPHLCPGPGTVRDGSFDDPGAWLPTGPAAVAGGTASLMPGCDGFASVEGSLSAPVAPASLELTFTGSAGALLGVELDGFAAGTVRGTGSAATARICLPAWAAGHVVSLDLQLADRADCTAPQTFSIESAAVIPDATCARRSLETFEDEAGWLLVAERGGSLARTTDPQRVRTGSEALAFDASAGCGTGVARATATIPTMHGGAGPALRYWYRTDGAVALGGPGRLPWEAGVWAEQVTCLDAHHAGELVDVAISFHTTAGHCDALASPAQASLDDVEVTLDPRCDGTPDIGEQGQPGTGGGGTSQLICMDPQRPPL
ncbi:calcium-binding EGF-like domain-containing protein [Vulgatibacter sp.]|uniref:calcium-binding EGF-like domain-containing protein n=1 Tax=Vulgatibacter sp. TaxID=1971226 RepID=UPI003565EBB0